MAVMCFIALFSGCLPTPTPVQPISAADAGTSRATRCSAACQHLRALKCADGQPTPDGATCETFCAADSAQVAAQLTTKYVTCLAGIKTCAAEAACAR